MRRRVHRLERARRHRLPLKASEVPNVKFRCSLYFVRDLSEGDVVTPGAVRSVRPGYGMAPKHIDAVIRKRAAEHIRANTPVLASSLRD